VGWAQDVEAKKKKMYKTRTNMRGKVAVPTADTESNRSRARPGIGATLLEATRST
jgi:hypothetical protein